MGRATTSGEPSSNKREVVLAAAVRCFAAHGLAGTGMRDIAHAAGLTEGTLYHYFPSKDALIEDAFRWSAFQASDLRAALQQGDGSLRERLLGAGAEFLAALRRDPDWTRVVIREALRAAPGRGESAVRSALVSLATERNRILAAALRDEMRSGRIARCDPRRVAEHLLHALIGHFVAEAISGSRSKPREGADPFLLHLVDTIAGHLERGRLRRASPGRHRAGGRAR
jgi:AcrR family transcriptional regulator